MYKAKDSGDNWNLSNNGLSNTEIFALAVTSSSSSTVFSGTYDGRVFKSVNSCGIWSTDYVKFSSGMISEIIINPKEPSNLYAATQTDGVFRSIDGGVNWIPINEELPSPYISSLVIDPVNPEILYAGTGFGAFRSTNSGEVWVRSMMAILLWVLMLLSFTRYCQLHFMR